jgi:hypothetical protein
VLSVSAAISICLLSHYEHTRAYRPSSLLWSYLCLNALFDATRTRTYWLLGDHIIAACFTANFAVNLLALVLEGHNKQSQIEDNGQCKSTEELAGPFSRSLFHWMNALMLDGYKRLLTGSDLSPIDSTLCSAKLRPRFHLIAKGIQSKPTFCRLCCTSAKQYSRRLFTKRTGVDYNQMPRLESFYSCHSKASIVSVYADPAFFDCFNARLFAKSDFFAQGAWLRIDRGLCAHVYRNCSMFINSSSPKQQMAFGIEILTLI